MAFETTFVPLSVEGLSTLASARKADGWRFVQMHCVNTEDGIDMIYSFMKDGFLENHEIKGVRKGTTVPSITNEYLEAFVFENEGHDLFGVEIKDIAIDFGGNFYALSQKEPMTIISPEQKAAREKAAKIAAAKAAKEKAAKGANQVYLEGHPEAMDASKKCSAPIIPPDDDNLEMRLAGVDPEKVSRVRAIIADKAKKAIAETAAVQAEKDAELEVKLAAMDPEKAAKVRAAMEAKAKKEAAPVVDEKRAAIDEKIAGLDPEKAAKVKAAMEAKAAREAAKEGE